MPLGDRIRLWLVTWFGLGLVPVVPGTAGTVGGVVLAVCLQAFLAPELFLPVLWGITVGLFLVGCSMSGFVQRHFGTEDPQAFVLDEVVGYLLTIAIYATLKGAPGPDAHAIGFLSFRVFDVFKLQPARRMEELPGAPGIMADDVVAGIYAGVVLLLALPLLVPGTQ